MKELSRTARAVWVRTNIRFMNTVSIDHLIDLLKTGTPPSEGKDLFYILAFFEEVYPSLMKKFMQEYSISRSHILYLFHLYEDFGEMRKFKEALADGKF